MSIHQFKLIARFIANSKTFTP